MPRSPLFPFRSLFSLLLLLSAQLLRGQGAPLEPELETFPPSSYEGHSQVFSGALDGEGRPWFGTSGQVLYHDGTDWNKFETIPAMAIMDLNIDDKGRVWIGGTGSFGYLRPLEGKGEHELSYPIPDSLREKEKGKSTGMEYVRLEQRLADSLKNLGTIWSVEAAWEGEQVLFNPLKELFLLTDQGLTTVLPRGVQFYHSHRVGDEVWVQDVKEGFFKVPKAEKLIRDAPNTASQVQTPRIPARYELPGSKTLASWNVQRILKEVPGITEQGEVLVITRHRGIHRYRYTPSSGAEEQERITKVKGQDERIVDVPMREATALDPSQNPWGASLVLSTRTNGVFLVDSSGKVVHVMDREKGFPANYVWETIKGQEGSGSLWSCTNKGVARWVPGDPKTYAYEGEAFIGKVRSITGTRKGTWLATSQGVHLREEDKGKKGRGGKWKRGPRPSVPCFDIIPWKEGVLIGSKYLFRARIVDGDRRIDTVLENYGKDLQRGKGPYKDMVAAGGKDEVLLLKKGREGEPELRLTISGLPSGVRSIALGPPPSLGMYEASELSEHGLSIWVSHSTKGVEWLVIPKEAWQGGGEEPRTIAFEELRKGNIEGGIAHRFHWGGLPRVETWLFDLKGRIVAGGDKGLYRAVPPDREEDKAEPTPLFMKKGWHFLPDSTLGPSFAGNKEGEGGREVFRLAAKKYEEGRETVWVQSSRHPLRLIRDREKAYRIDSLPFKGMGLAAVRGFHLDEDRVTWIGGDNGLVRFDGRVEKAYDRSFRSSIQSVKVILPDTSEKMEKKRDSVLFGGFYRKPDKGDSLLNWRMVQQQPEAEQPVLPYSMNGIIFEHSASFFEGEALAYSYKLKGFEDRWSEWSKETKKEYTNLPEGTYTYVVKARNMYGKVSPASRYRFRILPPWYRTWTAYGAYSLLSLGTIWFLIWVNGRRLRAQKLHLEKVVQERTKEIQKQKETIEEAHEEITRSIDYAQKIQQALLRSKDEAAAHIPEHFILFKPQGQVSGDFYWFKEHRGHLYFAAVDCTGHGVPGAFMSMLGISQLNEIMSTDEVPSPGAILTELRERVVRELSGSDPDETAKDGMDAAMVKIPLDKAQDPNPKFQTPSGEHMEVRFAGAQNPLYVVRKGIGEDPPSVGGLLGNDHGPSVRDRLKPFKKSPDGIEIKGDPMPVGYDEYAEGDFTTVSLQVQKGDMLYIFSDGYADQFGGEKGKKFRYGPFKQLLVDIHQKAMEEQRAELDRVFEEWKGDQGQIDDVLVMGVRV